MTKLNVAMWVALVGSLTLGVGALASRDGPVRVSVPQTVYDGGGVEVTVFNRGRGAVSLPACGAVALEVFEDEGYKPLPPPPCEGEEAPVRLKPGERQVYTLEPEPGPRRVFRPVATYALGCRAGVPLAQAECERVLFARGRFFSWASAGEEAPE